MEETFSHGDVAASKTRPTQSSSLHKGSYDLLKGHPCKLFEKSITAPGKHGPAKVIEKSDEMIRTCSCNGKTEEESQDFTNELISAYAMKFISSTTLKYCIIFVLGPSSWS